MALARWLETDSLSNQNISSALAIGAYTAAADRMIVCDVSLDQVAGGGDYVVYVTRQIAGAGSAYVMLPKTTCTAAAGETAIAMQSGPITVRSGDVLTVYVDGLAGDTTTPDTVVRWFEQATLRPDVADRQITVAATGEASANVTYWAGVAATAGAIPAAVAGATGGIAIVGSEMGLADSAITSAKFASGAITAAAIAADAIGASELAADAVAEIWAYTTRTLTQSSTSTTDSTAAGSISRRRGDSWSVSLTIGAITGYTSLWLTVKSDTTDADTASLLMVKKNASGLGDGLIYVNGAAASDAIKASITVSDATTGAIVIAVDESITDDLTPGAYSYDVQVLISGAVSTPDSGTFTVTADVTRAIA